MLSEGSLTNEGALQSKTCAHVVHILPPTTSFMFFQYSRLLEIYRFLLVCLFIVIIVICLCRCSITGIDMEAVSFCVSFVYCVSQLF